MAAWTAHGVPVSGVPPLVYLDDTGIAGGAWAPVVRAVPVDAAGNPFSPDGSPLTAQELAARAAMVPPFVLPPASVAAGVGNAAVLPGGFLYPNTALPPPYAAGAALGAPIAVANAPAPGAGGAGINYAAASVAPVGPPLPPPPPPPPAGVVVPRVSETGLGPLASGYPDAVLPVQYIKTVTGFRSYGREAMMRKSDVLDRLNELNELLGAQAEFAGAAHGYAPTIQELRYFLLHVLYYVACNSSSKKVENTDTVDAIAGGFEFTVPARLVVGAMEEIRRFCRCYTNYAYKNFYKFGLETPWAKKWGLNDPFLADYMEADLLPATVREDVAVGKSRALAKTSASAAVNIDPDVSDSFHETVVKNPKLSKTFRNAGLG